MKNYIYKVMLIFGGLCFGILEVVITLVLWAIVLPGIILNVIGMKFFKTKCYLLQLAAIPALSTIVSAELLGDYGKEAVESCLSENGYNVTYEDMKKQILDAIRG